MGLDHEASDLPSRLSANFARMTHGAHPEVLHAQPDLLALSTSWAHQLSAAQCLGMRFGPPCAGRLGSSCAVAAQYFVGALNGQVIFAGHSDRRALSTQKLEVLLSVC